MKIENRNAGMTLVETMAACVIMTILMTILIQGILAASNWFAESDRIKNSGEKTANRVEGSYDAEVSKTEEKAAVTLTASAAGDAAVELDEDENTKNTYAYDDIELKTIASEVEDYTPTAEDPVYEPTRVEVSNVTTIFEEITKLLQEEGYAAAGFPSEWAAGNNTSWIARILQEIGEWPQLSQEFKTKYNIGSDGEFGSELYIRAFFFRPAAGTTITENDVLFYVTDTKTTGGAQWRPLLIYDPLAQVWLRCPKRSRESGFFNRYVNYSLAGGTWKSCGSYSYYEEDGYTYLHANSEDEVNTLNVSDGAAAILDFVRNPENGWSVLYAEE